MPRLLQHLDVIPYPTHRGFTELAQLQLDREFWELGLLA